MLGQQLDELSGRTSSINPVQIEERASGAEPGDLEGGGARFLMLDCRHRRRPFSVSRIIVGANSSRAAFARLKLVRPQA